MLNSTNGLQVSLNRVLNSINVRVSLSVGPVLVSKVTGAKSDVYQYTPDPLSPYSLWVSETFLGSKSC